MGNWVCVGQAVSMMPRQNACPPVHALRWSCAQTHGRLGRSWTGREHDATLELSTTARSTMELRPRPTQAMELRPGPKPLEEGTQAMDLPPCWSAGGDSYEQYAGRRA